MKVLRNIITICIFLVLASGCVSKEVISQRQATLNKTRDAWTICVIKSARANAKKYEDLDFVADYSVEQCAKYRMPFVQAFMLAHDTDLVGTDKMAGELEIEMRRLARLDAMKVQQDMDAKLNTDFPAAMVFK